MLGILFAIGALLCWAFGDFYIQRTSRKIGIWKSLFFIALIGTLALSPFIADEISAALNNPRQLIIMTLAGVVMFFAALFDFEALKQGKFAIIEPILGIELPLTVALSVVFWQEQLSVQQALLIGIVFIGLILTVTINTKHLQYHKRILEKGVILAGLGAIGMGLTNFLAGVASQEVSPLMAYWFISLEILILCLVYLISTKQMSTLIRDYKKHTALILSEGILDNLAWILYMYAVMYIPISIAITISESYIALGVLLGLVINREKLRKHQKLGVALTVIGVIILAAITS